MFKTLNFQFTFGWQFTLLLVLITCMSVVSKPASAACETSWQACADGCLASVGLPPGDSGASAYCSTHGGLGAYACDDNMPGICYEPPAPCNNYSTSSSQYCGGGWQTGSITTTTTYNCYGSVVGQSSSDTCGCYNGYSWNGSSCVANTPPPPSCSVSTTSSSQYCGGGWQTGTITTTTTTNSDCTTSQSSSDTCGCYNGYSWNGSSCVLNTPPPPSCSPSTTSSNVACSAYGWQTGVITTTTRTYSDCSVNEGSTDNCGCYTGYFWNGSYCEAEATPEDGACGSSTNSCDAGSFSDVTDSSSNYLWNCYGIAGGSSTGCSRAKPGQCGFASGGTYSSPPTSASARCTLGTSSSVSGPSSGPWTWTCSTAGGSANCSSNYCAPPIAGSCNISVLNGCFTGDLVDLADSSTDYLWQCKGQNSGVDSIQCSKAKPPVVGGACNNGSLNSCISGSFNDTPDDSSNYNWQCLGSNGGPDANCSQPQPQPEPEPEPAVNGSCGGSAYSCSSGSAGGGGENSSEYYWNCYGENGGSSTGCSQAKPPPAPTPVNGSCGGSAYSCSSGSAGGGGENSSEYYWNCYGENGGSSTGCSQAKPPPAPTPVNGSCGGSAYSCSSGSSGGGGETSSQYYWNCYGENGGSSTGCSQAKPLPPGCHADGFGDESLSWDGWVGSGYYYCDEVYGSCPNALDGNTCCSRATDTMAWTRSRCY